MRHRILGRTDEALSKTRERKTDVAQYADDPRHARLRSRTESAAKNGGKKAMKRDLAEVIQRKGGARGRRERAMMADSVGDR